MLDRILIGSSVEPTDPNFRNVTLLLHGDGSNGAQNNTFLDSSTNNFTITRNGNTTQGSFSPYGSNWSNYFDGSADWLSVADNSAFGFGTGDFTIETWVFCAFNGAIQAIIDGRPSTTAVPWALSITGTGVARSYDGTVRTGGQLTANQWNHLAWVRSSGVNSVYVNGALGHSWTNSGDYGSTRPLVIGRTLSPETDYFNGYISNLRIVKGTAVYTSNFTPSTTPLTAITNTSLLTCQSNRFRDASTNNFTITRNGDVKVTNFAPFAPSSAYSTSTNGGSAYFDGSGDWLTAASNTAFAVGTGQFTLECWIYFNSVSNINEFLWTSASDTTGGRLVMYYSGGSLQLVAAGGAGGTSASWTPTAGQWYHIAGSRDASNNQRIFVNGELLATATSTNNYTENGFGVMRAANLNGFMTDIRLVKGTAVYTAAFTPPSAPLTAITNTSLLLRGTNATIFDNSMKNYLETVGNAQISTSVKKFGTGSMVFDGTGDNLICNLPVPDDLAFGSGDFTIELWAYMNSVSGIQVFYDGRPASVQTFAPTLYINGTQVRYFVNGSDRITGGTVATGTWYHIAVSRSGTSTRLFLNGTQIGSTYTDTSVYTNTASRPGIGFDANASLYYLNGYIDDLRVTKGIARYTANFTAPTAPFPNK